MYIYEQSVAVYRLHHVLCGNSAHFRTHLADGGRRTSHARTHTHTPSEKVTRSGAQPSLIGLVVRSDLLNGFEQIN